MVSTSFPFPLPAATRHHFSLSFICSARCAELEETQGQIPGDIYSAPRHRRLSGATDKRASGRKSLPAMWKPNGSNGETLCSHLHIQNTAVFSSGVAAIRAQLGARTPSQLAEVDAIKPMFAVCYLNTLSQGGNHRRRYYTFIINDLSDGFDTAARHADQRCSRRCDYSCAL